jgi:hypothetical protein
MMQALFDAGVSYLREHLMEVLITDVNMDCIPSDTVAKLSAITREEDIARTLLQLQADGSERCPNRSFVTVVLRQMVQRLCDDPVNLRWCQHCGVLVDVENLRRVNSQCRNDIICPQLGAGRVGPRGELLKTHEASIPVADNFLQLLPYPQAGPAVPPVENSEGIYWRFIGSIKFYRCAKCDTCVSLLHVRLHDCNTAAQGGLPDSMSSLLESQAIFEEKFKLSANETDEENLLKLFLSSLPPLPPIKKHVVPPPPLVTADDDGALKLNSGSQQGPYGWRPQMAKQAVPGGVVNSEMIRFNEMKLIGMVQQYVNSFAPAAVSNQATCRDKRAPVGILRSAVNSKINTKNPSSLAVGKASTRQHRKMSTGKGM